MKVYRFLTTLIVILFAGSVAKIPGTSIVAQEITDFELRNSSPRSPFPVVIHQPRVSALVVDELGRALPINQCKTEYSPIQADRCGFSAGHDDHLVTQADPKPTNEIDLSPLSFDCMNTGCEREYALSEREYRESMEESVELQPELSKQEVRQIIDAVFSKSLAINELESAEPVTDSEGYEPYVDPNQMLGTELTVANSKNLSLAEMVTLAEFWGSEFSTLSALNNPADFVSAQLVDLECRLCGTPLMNLTYSLVEAIDQAKNKLAAKRVIVKKLAAAKLAELRRERENEIAMVERNALIVVGFAKLTRTLGRTLIDVSDSISEISLKKVEAISVESH